MRNGHTRLNLLQIDVNHLSLGLLYGFFYSLRNFRCLAVAPADSTIAIANYYKSRKTKPTPTLYDARASPDLNNMFG